MSLLEYVLKVFEDRSDLTICIKFSSWLAMTVPAIFSSAISLAKFGPLKTPIVFFSDDEITSDNGLNGSSRIPFVQETKYGFSSIQSQILFTICSNTIPVSYTHLTLPTKA